MTKRRLVFVSLVLMFVMVTVVSIIALATPPLQAADTQIKEEGGGGKWEEVCCGKQCGVDYCTGNGTYVCCK